MKTRVGERGYVPNGEKEPLFVLGFPVLYKLVNAGDVKIKRDLKYFAVVRKEGYKIRRRRTNG